MEFKELFIQPYLSGNKQALSENNIKLLKNSVSEYAISNSKEGFEVVAEIFAGLMDGKKYPPEVMEIYHRLKGPMPKSPKN